MRPAAMYLYVLSSRTRRLYVGVTNDLVRRVWRHRDGTIRGFTGAAIRREKQIKSWARVKKLALVESMNPSWIDYADHWFPALAGSIPRYARDDMGGTCRRAVGLTPAAR